MNKIPQHNKKAGGQKDFLSSKWICRHCETIVPYCSRIRHLRKEHGIHDKSIRQHYFSTKEWREKCKERREECKWRKIAESYKKRCAMPEVKKLVHCGDKLNGVPKAKIIYNAVGTNRRKH